MHFPIVFVELSLIFNLDRKWSQNNVLKSKQIHDNRMIRSKTFKNNILGKLNLSYLYVCISKSFSCHLQITSNATILSFYNKKFEAQEHTAKSARDNYFPTQDPVYA